MKNLLPLFLTLFCAFQTFSQVGIGTTNPTSTLDIDGTIRVRGLKSLNSDVEAVRIVGLDEDGNFVEVDIDENLILKDNKISAIDRKAYYGAVVPITIGSVDNLNLLVLPGEPNDEKTVIPIVTTVGSIQITGIMAAEDGRRITLYAYSGGIRIWDFNAGSDPANQLANDNFVYLAQYDMVELMYDASIQKWVAMDR